MSTWSFTILGFAAIFLAGNALIRFRSRSIARNRSGDSFQTFRSEFSNDDASEEVILAVYMVFQDWESDAVVDFPVRANDDIGKIYGMVDEDLDDAVLDVIKRLNRHAPSPGEVCNMRPVTTVRDFVLFVDSCTQCGDNGT